MENQKIPVDSIEYIEWFKDFMIRKGYYDFTNAKYININPDTPYIKRVEEFYNLFGTYVKDNEIELSESRYFTRPIRVKYNNEQNEEFKFIIFESRLGLGVSAQTIDDKKSSIQDLDGNFIDYNDVIAYNAAKKSGKIKVFKLESKKEN